MAETVISGSLLERLSRYVRESHSGEGFWIERRRSTQYLTRPEFADAVAQVASGLRAVGVGQGDRVIIALPTSAEFATAFWGCQAVGAAAVPLAPVSVGRRESVEGRRLAAVLRRSRPKALLATDDVIEVARLESGDSSSWSVASPDPSARWSDLQLATVRPEDTAIIQFTSGSTGEPRGCVLTHEAVSTHCDHVVRQLGQRPPMKGVNWAPLFHDLGLIGGIVFPIVTNCGMVLQPTLDFWVNPNTWLTLLTKHRATLTTTTSSAVALAVRRLRAGIPECDLSSVQTIVIGAEPINPLVIAEFVTMLEPYGLAPSAIHPAYGLAENVLMVSGEKRGLVRKKWSRAELLDKACARAAGDGENLPTDVIETVSLGRPMPGAQIRVVDSAGGPCAVGRVGGVEVQSATTLTGYFEDEEATANVLRDGWLCTGDLGFLDETGELHLVGRSKDLIIVGGRNYYAHDLEHAASGTEGVHPHAVAAFAIDGETTEEAVLVVALRGGDPAKVTADVRARCNQMVGVVPRVVITEPHWFPRTTSGKPRRQEAKQRYLREMLANRSGTP